MSIDNKYNIIYTPVINGDYYHKKSRLDNNEFYKEFNVTRKLKVEYDKEKSIHNRFIELRFRIKFSRVYDFPISINYNYNTNSLNCSCEYCGKNNSKKACHHVASLIDSFNNGDLFNDSSINDSINQEYFSLIEKETEKFEENIRKETESTVKMFKKHLLENDYLPVKDKAHIIPVLNLNIKDALNLKCDLSLKVGNNKFYLIKDIQDFLERVKFGIDHQYSKNYSLVHRLENFDDQSKGLILELNELFSNIGERIYSKYKDVEIDFYFVDKIFDLYIGNVIDVIFKDYHEEVFISETKKKVDVKIEKNSFVINGKKEPFIIKGYKYDYIIENNILYRLECDDDLRPLVNFISLNKLSFKYVDDSFVKEIYSRYSEYITVNDDFKDKFALKDLDISVYFDINDDILSYNDKYYIGNDEIDEEEANRKYSCHKLTKFKNFINNLGFDGRQLKNVNNIGNFLKTDFEKFHNVATIYLSENIKKMQVKKISKSVTNLGYDTGMLSVCFENLNYTNEELYKILSGIKKKVKYVKLNKNTIIDLEGEEAKELEKVVNEFQLDEKHLAEKQVIPLYQSLKLLNNTEDFKFFTTDEIIRKILSDIANYKNSDFSVPESLRQYMRDYQVDAFKWMKTLIKYNFSGILADDMGLGKTLEIISIIESDDCVKPSLIVCPKSLAYNWSNEFNKWNCGTKAINIVGNSSERNKIISNIRNNEKVVYITSYDSLKNDLDSYKDKEFRYMILDEAQFIKNHTTLKAQSVKQINSSLRFVLTGTPIENTVVDLWSIFDFLMPNYLYNYNNFKLTYEREITTNRNSEIIGILVKKITPFILRRTKEEVLKDLPEKIETIMYAEMTSAQKKIYQAQLLKTKDIIKGNSSKIEILAQLTRLRQVCVDPSLFIDDYNEMSGKIELAVSLINDLVNEGHKILLFSQFTSVFPILEKYMEKNNINYFKITGKTDAFERVEMANRFNDEESKEKVFFVSLKAGGTGLNLTGADVVIHLDPWWNVSAENQATDRAHRIGQKNIVRVIKLVCENSIEQKVLDLQEAKKQIINDIIADNDDNIVKLNDNDLIYLLS